MKRFSFSPTSGSLTYVATTVRLFLAVAILLVIPGMVNSAAAQTHSEGPPVVEITEGIYLFGDLWEFSGQVTNCDQVSGLTITWGGLAAGNTSTTANDGTFIEWIEIPAELTGDVTAETVCPHGMESEVGTWWIDAREEEGEP